MKNFLSLFIIAGILLVGCNSSEPEEASRQNPQAQEPKADRSYNTPQDSLSALITQSGGTAELFAERALLYLEKQQVKAAFNDLNQALLLDSTSAKVHEAKGEYHLLLDQLTRARDEWETCLKYDPQNSACLMRLSRLMIAMNRFDRALELVNRQLQNDKNDPRAYFMKGMIVRDRNKDTALALQYFQQAIDLDQDYFDAVDMMAVTLTHQNDTLAKFYYDRLLELDPERADTYYKIGVYHMNQDEPNRALEAYTQAIKLNPRDANSYYNLGYMHMELAQYQQARDYFTKAIQFGEQDYLSYFGRGYSFEVGGDLLNARKDYRAALKDLPMYKPAQKALGRVNAMIKEAGGE